MFYQLINYKRNLWLQSDDCTIRSLLDYIIKRGMMRDAQLEAIKTYLFLKIACGNKPLWRLFVDGVFNDINIGQMELTETAREVFQTNKAAVALFQYSRLQDKKGIQLAPQLESFIKQHADTPIILAGDFNDIPNSFVHHTIVNSLKNDGQGVSFTDCYQETGFGPGYTFKHFGIRERIDNIFCSSHFTPYNCHIVKDIKVSDHQPITCKLKIQR